MVYTKDSLQRLFQSKINMSKWQMVLKDYFRADKVRIQPEALDEDSEERKGYFLGETTTKDNYKMGFFYYDMEDGSVLRRKVGLRNLVRPYLGYGFDAALAVFNDGENWRLSLICDLKSDAEATNAKRFTYVFGDEKAFYKTPVKRFVDLQKKADEYLEIKNAFSVEALSDDFFDEYRKQYAEFVKFLTGKVYVKKGNKWIEQEVGEPDEQFFTSFGKDEKLVRDYIKKMMGRIVFLYFLQSKGWLGGNLHYMHDLFDNASDAVKADFLDNVLEPMFFGLLNTKPKDRATAPLVNGVGVKYIPDAETIPYLNGGLFQQEKIDEVDSRFPAEMFQSLFDFFDSYNFTIDENDPNDAEVGVDPEMLGKIFENLLEDNKDKGAFYTPKEIVRYMCQESLIAYLQTGVEDEETKKGIANFVKTNDVEELGGASSDLAMSIDQKLKDVKICDPAIGSGAFPMGLLRELYACRKAIEVFESDNAADIKRHIIQNNIYGVDIEKGAVDIARLRFWLALIIDEKEPMPLPNLDFKIMQGNSLLESFMGVDLNMTSKKVKTGRDTKKTRGVLSLGFEETDVQKTIQDLVKSYFSITDHTLRAQRRKEIDKYVKDYIKICAEGNQEVQAAVDELEIPNSQFFLWHTYFNDVFEKGGFDIVIGNPPYIDSETMAISQPVERKLYSSQYQTAKGNWDIYVVFYERGMNLLNDHGVLSYITPNKWLSIKYGTKMRELYFGNIWQLGDCKNIKVFDAGNEPVVCFFSKENVDKLCIEKFNVDYSVSKVNELDKSKIDYSNLGICISENINLLIKINSQNQLCSYVKVENPFTTGEAYELIPLIKDSKDSVGAYRLVNTGLIDPYVNLWGLNMITYLKNKYLYPVIDKKEFKTKFPKRVRQADAKKIIISGMRYFESFFDKDGAYIAGKSTIIISGAKTDDMFYLLLAFLNSKLMTFYINQSYSSLGIGGGINFSKDMVSILPIPNLTKSRHDFKELVNFSANLNMANVKNVNIAALENQIDFLVYHLYGLTYDEVLIVDPNTPITREEYEAYKGE